MDEMSPHALFNELNTRINRLELIFFRLADLTTYTNEPKELQASMITLIEETIDLFEKLENHRKGSKEQLKFTERFFLVLCNFFQFIFEMDEKLRKKIDDLSTKITRSFNKLVEHRGSNEETKRVTEIIHYYNRKLQELERSKAKKRIIFRRRRS